MRLIHQRVPLSHALKEMAKHPVTGENAEIRGALETMPKATRHFSALRIAHFPDRANDRETMSLDVEYFKYGPLFTDGCIFGYERIPPNR